MPYRNHDHQKRMEDAACRHWTKFHRSCADDGIDEITFLASLAASITQLLREHPKHADTWLAGIAHRLREERALLRHGPN